MGPNVTACLNVVLIAATISNHSCGHSSRGKILEIWKTSNSTFSVQVSAYAEENGGFVAGAYYVFSSAKSGTNSWHEFMVFKHDDPVPIPRDQVQLAKDKMGYVFMGWMYAVTIDGGGNWSVWNALTDLPNWTYGNYGIIQTVIISADGSGTMTFSPIPERRGEPPVLCTKDYGRHWIVKCD